MKKILFIVAICFLTACSDEGTTKQPAPETNKDVVSLPKTDVAEDEGSAKEETKATPAVENDVIADTSRMRFVEVSVETSAVRQAADSASEVLVEAKKGDVFSYLKEMVKTPNSELWYKVALEDGAIGYMQRNDTNLLEQEPKQETAAAPAQQTTPAPAATPAPAPAATPAPAPKPAPITVVKESYMNGDAIEITSAQGNIRAEAHIDSPVVYTGNKGQQFYFLGTAVTTSDGRIWYYVYINSHIGSGYMSSAVGKVVFEQSYDPVFIVTTAGANVRANPDINAAVVFTANNGAKLTYLYDIVQTADGRTWYYVTNGQQTGYISGNTGYLQ